MATHDRILVVRTDRIGDVVLATPLIRALRQAFPNAFIAAMVRPYARDVLLNNPHVNEIIEDDDQGLNKGRKGFWKQVENLKRYHFDTALLLLPTERLAWMLFFARIPYRITSSLRLYTVLTGMRSVRRQKYNPLRSEADYCLDLGRKLGVQTNDLNTEIFLTAQERDEGRKILRSAGVDIGDRIVGIHPGSGGSSPNWTVGKYVELAAKLLNGSDLQIVVTGSAKETHFWSEFEKIRSRRIINLIGKLTLRQLIIVISHYECLFSPSTGPMHIAAALKVPTVSLFCPLPACSPALWGPQGNRSEVLLPRVSFCQKDCEIDPKKCTLEGIEVKRAHAAIKKILEERSKN